MTPPARPTARPRPLLSSCGVAGSIRRFAGCRGVRARGTLPRKARGLLPGTRTRIPQRVARALPLTRRTLFGALAARLGCALFESPAPWPPRCEDEEAGACRVPSTECERLRLRLGFASPSSLDAAAWERGAPSSTRTASPDAILVERRRRGLRCSLAADEPPCADLDEDPRPLPRPDRVFVG